MTVRVGVLLLVIFEIFSRAWASHPPALPPVPQPIDWDQVTFGVEFTAVDPQNKNFSATAAQIALAAKSFAARSQGTLKKLTVTTSVGNWEFHEDGGALEVSGPPLTLQQYRERPEIEALFQSFAEAGLEPEIGFGGTHGGGGHIHIDEGVFISRPILLRNFVVSWRQSLFRQIFQECFDTESAGPEACNSWRHWDSQSKEFHWSRDWAWSYPNSIRELDKELRAFTQGRAFPPNIQRVASALMGASLEETASWVQHYWELIEKKATPVDETIKKLKQALQRTPKHSKEWKSIRETLEVFELSPEMRRLEESIFLGRNIFGQALVQEQLTDFRMGSGLADDRGYHPTLEVRGFSAPTSREETIRRVEFIVRYLQKIESRGHELIPPEPIEKLTRFEFSRWEELQKTWTRFLKDLNLRPEGYLEDLRRHRKPLLQTPELRVDYVHAVNNAFILELTLDPKHWSKFREDFPTLSAELWCDGRIQPQPVILQNRGSNVFAALLPTRAGDDLRTRYALEFNLTPTGANQSARRLRLDLGNFVYRGPHAKPMSCVELLSHSS